MADAGPESSLITNWVGRALAIGADGRPLADLHHGGSPGTRVDPLDPVVIAFQGMVQDALGRRGRPVSAVYGEKVLSLVPGRAAHVATVARGRPDLLMRASMEAAVEAIETRWGGALDAWSGDPGELEGLAAELVPVVGRTADRGPGEVDEPLNARGVFPVSAVDFEGGRARLKVAVFACGFLDLRGGFMELSFGRGSLRVDGTKPASALGDGDVVRLPTVPTGEEATVAVLMEPLSPGRHLVEGTLTFYDDANNPRHLEVPRREFDVVFPALSPGSTPPPSVPPGGGGAALDEAVRSWRYPASLGGLDVLRVARTVLGTRGLVLSPGAEATGPPPAWEVDARAMAGRAPLQVTLRVTGGDARRLELRAASTDPWATAGAMAEMRHLLVDAFFRRWRGQVELEEEGVHRVPQGGPPATDIDIYVPWR